MDRRAFERIPAGFKARFLSLDPVKSSVVINFTEQGMCIRTGNCLPCDDTQELLIPSGSGVLKLLVKVRRIEKIDDLHYTLGVELPDPPDEYLAFVAEQRDAFKSLKGIQFNRKYRLFNYDL